MKEPISRRTFVRGAAATGVAATGITAVGGQAAAQQDVNVNANQLFSSGLIVVQGVNVTDVIDVEDVTVEIIEDSTVLETITIDVEDIRVLNDNVVRIEDVLSDITLDISDNVVQVNVLSDGTLVGSDTVQVPGNLR